MSFLETHLSSQRQLCYEENMCNYSVSQEIKPANLGIPMRKIKFPFKLCFQKRPESIDPADSFSNLYLQGALEGK